MKKDSRRESMCSMSEACDNVRLQRRRLKRTEDERARGV